jgi:hypothetical protein
MVAVQEFPPCDWRLFLIFAETFAARDSKGRFEVFVVAAKRWKSVILFVPAANAGAMFAHLTFEIGFHSPPHFGALSIVIRITATIFLDPGTILVDDESHCVVLDRQV